MYPLLVQSENERTWEVSNYQHLDKFYAEKLQELVNTVSLVFEAPIVYVSFIEEFRQVLIAKKGMYPEEIRREDSFCDYLIQKGTPIIINDTHQDIKFKLSPLVKFYPKIRFYAGVPIVSKNGFVLGSFCICDIKHRQLNNSDEQILLDFSNQITEVLELNRLFLKTKNNNQKREKINSETLLSDYLLKHKDIGTKRKYYRN